MNRNIFISLIIVSLFMFSGTVLAGGPDFKEGLWEITMQMEMSGMPMQMPPQKFSQCITKDNNIPMKKEEDKNCKIESKKISGNTISYKVVCKEKDGTYVTTGTITYKGDTFTGNIEVKTPDGMQMKQKMSGKWTGKCK